MFRSSSGLYFRVFNYLTVILIYVLNFVYNKKKIKKILYPDENKCGYVTLIMNNSIKIYAYRKTGGEEA